MAAMDDTKSRSEEVRAKLDHPVIDADGHLIEVEPVLLDYLKMVGDPPWRTST